MSFKISFIQICSVFTVKKIDKKPIVNPIVTRRPSSFNRPKIITIMATDGKTLIIGSGTIRFKDISTRKILTAKRTVSLLK
ncbi:hypothetical protein FACS1894152_3410 [Bacilli bacterium]|nr:hypothetical protein FACS1894152_3410 [Bacilli bacterium]